MSGLAEDHGLSQPRGTAASIQAMMQNFKINNSSLSILMNLTTSPQL